MGAWFPVCGEACSLSPGRPGRAAVAELPWKGGLALLCCTRVTLSSGMWWVDTLEFLGNPEEKNDRKQLCKLGKGHSSLEQGTAPGTRRPSLGVCEVLGLKAHS